MRKVLANKALELCIVNHKTNAHHENRKVNRDRSETCPSRFIRFSIALVARCAPLSSHTSKQTAV